MEQLHTSTIHPAGDAAPGTLPAVPRPLTGRAARRAWGDLRVRPWWLSAAAVAIVIAWFSAGRIHEGLRSRAIIQNGIPLNARITAVEGVSRPGYALLRDDRIEVKLSGQMPDGSKREFEGSLPPGPGYLTVGETLPIRVDRDDPSVWTARTEVDPWYRELALTILFLPVIAGLLVIAMLMRRRVLRTWREGSPLRGVVVEARQSAMAPGSRLVRYALDRPGDKRVFSILCPSGPDVPARGDVIELLALPGHEHRAVLARLYA